MGRTLLILTAIALAAAVVMPPLTLADPPGAPEPAADGGPTVIVNGVIIWRPAGGDAKWKTPPLGEVERTQLVLLVEPGQGRLIALDLEASRLDSFTDDKGRDLVAKPDGQDGVSSQVGFSPNTAISEDGKAAVVQVQGRRVPTAGATQLSAGGTLVFQHSASGRQVTHLARNVKLKKGETFKLGDVTFTIRNVTGMEVDRYKLRRVEVTHDRDLDALGPVRFLDGEGKEIASKVLGWGSSRAGGQIQHERTFLITQDVESVSVSADGWADAKPLAVPFRVKAGLGL